MSGGSGMYRVYRYVEEGESVFEFEKMDNAIRCCFFLRSEGYRIEKVVLPTGHVVNGGDIMRAVVNGVNATRLLLKSA
jgi:hypothetical protein